MLRHLFILSLILGCAGCGVLEPAGSGDRRCVAGQSVSCACVGGATGAQVCKEDASGFEACQCDTCMTGDRKVCSCADGSTGLQTCLDERYQACMCTSTAPPSDMSMREEEMSPSPADMSAELPDVPENATDMGGSDMQVPPPCQPYHGAVCEASSLLWQDSCGNSGSLIQSCELGCAQGAPMCERFNGYCFGDCPIACEQLQRADLPLIHLAPRRQAPFHPSLYIPTQQGFQLGLLPEGEGFFGGSFQAYGAVHLLLPSDVPVTLTQQLDSGGEIGLILTRRPTDCGVLHSYETMDFQESVIVEIGPAKRDTVRFVRDPNF